MAFWHRWTGRKATSEDVWRQLYAGAPTSAGVTVNADSALQASVVLACVRLIAEGMAQVPFRLMRAQGDERLPASDHPLAPLIDNGPNEWQTMPEFVEQIGLHLGLCSNAYVWKNTVRGRIVELLPWEPKYVTVTREGYSLRYVISIDGSEREIPAAEMWHIRGPSWNGYEGLEGWKLAREAIGLSLAAEAHGASTFKNGAQLGGILSTDATMTKQQRDGLRASWQEVHGGRENSGKVAVLSNGYKFQSMSATNTDAQWLDARRFQIEEICRAFRVMPIMVGYSDKTATYASAEQMFIAHVVHTMGPWYRRVEASANKALLTDAERENGLYFKFFTNALLRGAVRDRGEFYRALYGIGAISPNEIRALEDMNPYAGGEKYRVPLNMADPNADPQGIGNGTP